MPLKEVNVNPLRLLPVLAAVCLLPISGCGTITPIQTKLSPSVSTLAKNQTKGIDPQNCNDWTSPSWLDLEAMWRGLPLSQPPRAGLNAFVGFEILFDTQGNCRKFRQDLFRAGFAYDLSAQQRLKGLVTKAELSLTSKILPSGVRPNNLCQARTGGGGSLIVLAPTATLPTAPLRFAYLGSANAAAPYPSGSRLFSIPQPWLSGTIAPGVTSVAAPGSATFIVDVTDLVNARLNQGAGALSFMISGSDEAVPTAFIPGPQDCKSVYEIGELVVTHL